MVNVARENNQRCDYVLKAVCTYLSQLKEGDLEKVFASDWTPVSGVDFHRQKMNFGPNQDAKKKNMMIVEASEQCRGLVGLRIKVKGTEYVSFEVILKCIFVSSMMF